MRKLPTFYGKVTEFLKPYILEGVVACGIRGRRILKLADYFLHYFIFFDELLTISARSQTASPPSGETGER